MDFNVFIQIYSVYIQIELYQSFFKITTELYASLIKDFIGIYISFLHT